MGHGFLAYRREIFSHTKRVKIGGSAVEAISTLNAA
jgi:hypothetical protein